MKHTGRHLLRVLAVALPLTSHPAAAVELDHAQQSRLGLRLQALRAANFAATVEGVALTLDPVPLIRLNGELNAAAATAAASGTDAQRLGRLQQADGNVSLRAVEAARAQATSERAKHQALLAELRGNWGSALAAMPEAAREAMVSALASGSSLLVRVESLGRVDGPPPQAAVLQLSADGARRLRILGPWPQAGDGANAAWLGVIDGTGLVPGIARPAQLETTTRLAGVLIPRSAVLRWNGMQWAYVATDAEHFERRALSNAQPRAEGWLVSIGFSAGEQVVVQGAAALLGAETLEPAETE